MATEQEQWTNSSAGLVYLWKFDRHGDPKDEVVGPGKKLLITEAERAYNQENTASAELDIFRNGIMRPVKLLDGTEDAAEIATNPNLIAESDMRDLFKAHWRTFEQKVGEISSLGTLDRLTEIAQEGEATVRQMDVLKARKAELTPQFTEVTSTAIGHDMSRAVSPTGRI